jgi:hypothetical protein
MAGRPADLTSHHLCMSRLEGKIREGLAWMMERL